MSAYPEQVKILEMLERDLKSPYANVSDDLWRVAHEQAQIDSDTETPTFDQVDAALEALLAERMSHGKPNL